MALVVEDGTGKSDAESYASVAYADTYNTNYISSSAWSAASDTEKEVALRRATQYIDSEWGMKWGGERRLTTQALDWPRSFAYYADGRSIDSDEIPNRLQQACCQLAVDALSTPLLETSDPAAGVIKESVKLGPISETKEYAGAKTSLRSYSMAHSLLSALTGLGGVYRV
jgi:hypothetical protein